MSTSVRFVGDISVPTASGTNGYADRMTYSRLIGALFLVGFLVYGVALHW
jgi:hypothetical protein